MAIQRPREETRANAVELATALATAWRALFEGAEPSRSSLLVLLAQWDLETGGGAHCICWNLGNAKSVAGDGYDWCEFPTTEVIRGAVIHVTARFRAFETLEAGAADYLRLLSHRFANAWPCVLAGDAEGFARALHELGYYTAPVEAYTRGMLARRDAIDRAWPERPTLPVTWATDDEPVYIAPELPDAAERYAEGDNEEKAT